ncbi:MAG: TatD family hydrolase [Deltaproteobacteria bacterium]|jgi:TatD DNase family protein|nr:TatD family hydrolase [Deltaproteobacteria bacterium]
MSEDKSRLIDSHCHLFLPDYDDDRPEVARRADSCGVKTVVNVGLDALSSRQAIALAEEYPGYLAAVGWHPHESFNFRTENIDELKILAQKPKVVALGEIGLDFYRLHSPQDCQEKVFHLLLELAAEMALPVVIHTRAAFDSTVSILKEHRKNLSRLLIHCFTGTWSEAKTYLELDCYFSVPGVITFPKAQELREALPQMPKNRLLLETDGPYLAPIPRRGRRNEPAYLTYVLEAVAEVLRLDNEETAQMTSDNARNFFGLSPDNWPK